VFPAERRDVGVAALFQGNSIGLSGPLPKADLDATKVSLQSIFGSWFTFGSLSNADTETASQGSVALTGLDG